MKLDRKKIDKFWEKREKIKDPRVSTHFKTDSTHLFDLALIRKYVTPKTKLLDLACGTCFLSNELVNEVAYIKAMDKFGRFLKHCNISDTFITEEADLIGYKDNNMYDIILGFGIMNYFDNEEASSIYKNMATMLSKDGVFIVKHQSGINEDVLIDAYSDQIGDTYHALYRNVNTDKKLLEQYFQVEVIDIYPSKLNPWPNTHFYAFVCKHK